MSTPDGLGMSVVTSAHIGASTEVTVTEQDGGTLVLKVGSVLYTSPSRAEVRIFAGSPADLRRIADAITTALAAAERR